MNQKLALHEALEVHEILANKTIGCTKSFVMQSMARDQELQSLLIEDVRQAQQDIIQLKNLLQPNDMQ